MMEPRIYKVGDWERPSAVLVGRVDDLHELLRLQRRAADQAAVRPTQFFHCAGTPFI
ncbi:hypothetical protein IB211_02697 [Intestinimonas butyriciproducens]|uniref:Uncharacterized protein n=1 Tax=Intestinimonas butyriciproducens TaxID=1297617 RepID=A0A0S2W7X2_9FIRM|nr:hypothetical protein IB211_02697 [Intestinimonas butyriciproducens]